MDENEQRYFELMNKELEATKLRVMSAENNLSMSSFGKDSQQDMISAQLDLKEELDRIYHLLSGHMLMKDNNGEKWIEPEDDRLKIFSEYGVKQIMNIISFYINKNTLLSNYSEEVITWKVRDFAIELSDLIFNRYEAFFSYPSPEDLFIKLRFKDLKISDDELYEKCVIWSREELQAKLRHYPMIILALTDSIHSTFLRAYGGKERESLRKAFHVSGTDNSFNSQPTKSFSMLKPSTW